MDGRRTGNCSGVPRQSPSRARRGVRGADTRVQTCGGLTGVRAKAALGGDHGSVSLEGFRMEFHVRLDGARPDLDALGDAIREVDPSALLDKIGRASCRERVCQYV